MDSLSYLMWLQNQKLICQIGRWPLMESRAQSLCLKIIKRKRKKIFFFFFLFSLKKKTPEIAAEGFSLRNVAVTAKMATAKKKNLFFFSSFL